MLEWCCNKMGFDVDVIKSHQRDYEVVYDRAVCCCFLRLIGYSYEAIGREMNKHHTSSINLVKKYGDLCMPVAIKLMEAWKNEQN